MAETKIEKLEAEGEKCIAVIAESGLHKRHLGSGIAGKNARCQCGR